MEITAETCINVLHNSFNYQKVKTILGTAIKMDWKDAFLFANVTGASYLDDTNYPFTPKGVLKVLREAFDYNLVTGIFDRNKLFYSPYEMNNSYPFLFNNDKYIIPIECSNEQDYSNQLKIFEKKINENNEIPTDYIFLRIEKWKNGNGMECFLEYSACEYFKKQGFIVENQIPLVADVGSPDFGGYKLKSINKGFHIIELSLVRLTKAFDLLDTLLIEDAIVGEAKTATTIMANQLEKYLNTDLFNYGIEMHPDKASPTKDCFGILNIDSNYLINVRIPKTKYIPVPGKAFDKDEYLIWLQNYIKYYLISNLSDEEFQDYIKSISGFKKLNEKVIIDTINNLSINSIIQKIREVC